MLTVSVSDLQSFRRYRTDEEMPLSVLMKILRREEPPTEKMLAGSAMHAVLERCTGDLTEAEAMGHRFIFSLDAAIQLPTIREMRGHRDFVIDGTPIRLKARVDGLEGLAVEEIKLRNGAFDAERYAESYQWRCYLVIFGAKVCHYNVFLADPVKDDSTDLAVWDVHDFHRLPLYTYPEIISDVEAELARYVDFARAHLSIAA